MEKANFPSVRGKFSYGNNVFQYKLYSREVVKTQRSGLPPCAVVLKNHQDTYAKDCSVVQCHL